MKLKSLKPTELLKMAAVSLALIVMGHSFAHFFSKSRGFREDALFNAMKGFKFPMMGMTRSHWDFYQGYSLVLLLGVSTQIVLLWLLSNLLRNISTLARPMILVMLVSISLFSILCWVYFFTAPALMATLAAVFVGRAYVILQGHPRK